MHEWYAQIAATTAHPYISELARLLAVMFFMGFVPGIVSLTFSGQRK